MEELSGVRPPREHQTIARNILYNLIKELLNEGYEPFMEVQFDDNDNSSQSPDLLVEDHNGNILLIIEITKRSGVKKDKTKVEKIMKKHPMVNEGFIYNYEDKIWHKYTRFKIKKNLKQAKYVNHNYYSDLFDIDLRKFTSIKI